MQNRSQITVPEIKSGKSDSEKLVMITAYDYPSAKMVDKSEADIILVGDSVGMVVLGHNSTLPVTMDEMLHHTKAVSRAAPSALIVADMPYLSYHIDNAQTLKNAGKFIKETSAQAVKIEGGEKRIETVKALIEAEIPVMGHLGLTPQSIHKTGGYTVQGKEKSKEQKLIEDAQKLEDAGIFSLVLECVPRDTAKKITEVTQIPTIGIGAGPDCDGQVLVYHDLLGVSEDESPKFVREYAQLRDTIPEALTKFVEDVREGEYPSDEESYH